MIPTISITGLIVLVTILTFVIVCFGILINNPRRFILGIGDNEYKEQLSNSELEKFEIN